MPIIRDPTKEEIAKAEQLIKEGYYQISRKYRHIARLPEGMTGKQALKLVTPPERHYWVEAMGESSAGDHYLSCYSPPNQQVVLDIPTFMAFRQAGGNTYRASHWANDEDYVTKVFLCESRSYTYLPNRTYRIEVHPSCELCSAICDFLTAELEEWKKT